MTCGCQQTAGLNGLGDVIRWAPLGPGGDPQMSLQGAGGALSSRNVGMKLGALANMREPYQRMKRTSAPLQGLSLRGAMTRGRLGTALSQEQSAFGSSGYAGAMDDLDTLDVDIGNEVGNLMVVGFGEGETKGLYDSVMARYDGFQTMITDLIMQTATGSAEDEGAYITNIKAAQAEGAAIWAMLMEHRRDLESSKRITGVLWGAGALAVAGGVLALLWTAGKKK